MNFLSVSVIELKFIPAFINTPRPSEKLIDKLYITLQSSNYLIDCK